jgi:hypothetical protein
MPYICSCSLLISRSCFSRSTTYHLPGNRVTRAPQVVLTSAMPELNNAKNSARARSSCAIMETRYSLASCGIPVQAHCRIRSLLWSKASGKGPASRYVEPNHWTVFHRFLGSKIPLIPSSPVRANTRQLPNWLAKIQINPAAPLSMNGERGRGVRSAGTHNIIRKLPVSLCALRVFAVKNIPSQPAPSHHHPQIFTQKKSKNFLKSVSEHRPLCVKNTPMWIGKEARRA